MKNVLIIDDDVTFQLTMGEKLREAGYNVFKALDGEVGIEQARACHPDLILLDIKMPKLDGISFLRQLRAEGSEDRPVPVYITSNMSSMEKIGEGVELGIRGYIIKSGESLDTILTAVNGTLERVEEEQKAENAKHT